jgi:hypothetical protein
VKCYIDNFVRLWSCIRNVNTWDWFCGWWASKDFRVISEQNRQNLLSKSSVNHYDANGHVYKTQRTV